MPPLLHHLPRRAARSLNAVTSLQGLRVERGVQYGPHAAQLLDVYAPDLAAFVPVVVFAHGGGWVAGHRDEFAFVGESLARAGLVTLVIGYRLAPEHPYPAYVQDYAQALAWAQGHVREYGGSGRRLFAAGYSAGAFNAMEAVVNERFLAEVNVDPNDVRGVIGLAGPYDFDFRGGAYAGAFGPDTLPEDVMPARHVRPNPPPALLLTGQRDRFVATVNTVSMARALREQGGAATHVDVPRLDHVTLLGALGSRLRWLGPVRQLVLDFVQAHAG